MVIESVALVDCVGLCDPVLDWTELGVADDCGELDETGLAAPGEDVGRVAEEDCVPAKLDELAGSTVEEVVVGMNLVFVDESEPDDTTPAFPLDVVPCWRTVLLDGAAGRLEPPL